MVRQVSELAYIYIFIDGGEVCGRYADDTRLIHASVNTPTSVVGFSFQTPQACDHLDLWVTFLPGEQGLHFDTKPCCFGTTKTIPSCLAKYPPPIVAAVVSALESSLAAITAMLAEKPLAEEQHPHEAAAREKALADKANEQHQVAAREKALADEAHEQGQMAEHATTLAVMALTKLKAAPKVRYGGPQPTHFFPAAHRRRGGQA